MKSPKNISASVRQRILNRAKGDRRPFNGTSCGTGRVAGRDELRDGTSCGTRVAGRELRDVH